MACVWLKKDRDKSTRLHHPWIFSGAIDKVEGTAEAGDIVRVLDSKGEFLAWGHFSPHSQIRVRLLEWHEDVRVDEGWWQAHLAAAIDRRREIASDLQANAYRLVYAEADMLPGLIVDRYGDFLVLQALTAGVEKIKVALAQQLGQMLKVRGIYERSDAEVRKLEGLEPASGPLIGDTPDDLLEIREAEDRFLVDVKAGQKTGFFLDQRANRKIVAGYAAGRNVLDCFAYTGGFSVYALGAGAKSITGIDSSAAALDLARQNIGLNRLDSQAELVLGNAFEILREYRDAARSFDMIILDPPKLAPTRGHADKAARAYKDINLLALKLLEAGGILATFSCSGGIDAKFFREIIFWASQDAGREVQILEQLSQGNDHPIRLTFPESEYLKGLVLRVLS